MHLHREPARESNNMHPPSYTVHVTAWSRLRREPRPPWSLTVVAALLMLGTASAQVPNERCVECHGRPEIALLPIRFSDGEEVSPHVDAATISRSVHAKLACIECHPGSHPEFAGTFGPRNFPTRREYAREIGRTCRDCHKAIFKPGHGTTSHHSAYRGGDGPLCVDCHSGHETRRVSAATAAAPVMEGTKSWNAMFATKGIEYLLVLGYLAMFVPFAILLHRIAQRWALLPQAEAALPGRRSSWFQLPEGFFVHRGHTWALPEGGGVFKVGMDDFAGHLIGPPAAMMLPSPGERLDQGERGWQVRVNGNILDVLSPVRGEILEINEQVVNSPSTAAEDPYGKGWLMKVRARQPQAAVTNLLSGRLARAWYDEVEEDVGSLMQGHLGTVLQDGGLPIYGFAREIAGDRWPELAAKFLLTTSSTASPQ